MAGWKAKLLSPGGKLILIKHVLSSIPIHVLSVFDVPQRVINRIQSIMVNFLWGGAGDVKKRHWLSWDCVTSLWRRVGWGLES